MKRKQTKKKYPPYQSAQSTFSFPKLNIEVTLISQTYQELDIIPAMNFSATETEHFQKDAAAFRSKISRKASVQVNKRKQLFENSKYY